ncbi:hypothetical protein S40288_09056 [Stachybotrys chartarum IBT 40288]|nr:hypothetical protein S40288_09056 [Stachybotrys chartarum IBT 40288]
MAELMQHAVTKGFVSQEDVAGEERDEQPEGEEDAYEFSTDPEQPSMCLNPPNEEDVRALIHLYFVSVNQLYGFVDRTETSVDLQTYLTLRRQPGFSTQTLHGQQAHHFFRITMICAISCANQARYRPQRTAECLAYYADAVACVEDVTSEVTAASLQALLLLIVFCLFNPRKGDIWKLLDHACRLTIELGYHTEETEPEQPRRTSLNTGGLGSGPEMTTAAAVGGVASTFPSESVQARNKLRRSTFWGLYAIERIVGQLFGRGSDLPETIITAEYPSSLYALHTGFSPLATVTGPSTGTNNGVSLGGVDQEALQSMSIAHHYRLVYLRSEIFRVMYLPASPPSLGLNWLKERHAMLYAWRRELAVSDDLEGVATLTCDVGYDCTMCFLFQPLLLKALRDTMAPEGSPGRGDRPAEGSPGARSDATGDDATGTGHPAIFVASDPFYSAINLIRTYEKIIRGPERSTLGTYPMTFLSAHYICIACSTLIAHALLRVDGRTKTLRRMSDGSSVVSEAETEELDWGAFLDVSGSCLILLAWCGERWPGMLSMLGVYQKFMTRMTRELIGLGLVT